ncbi:hypothetical protein PSH58_12565 [Pseudomonas hefeiensis]|uniref:Uncharacterized protein n=1 Tax=Pseudomonas hefeiensis TaxID=2738125 RepID=A0ABY9GHD9_9PSED|nr:MULTISPECIES: hypothetical protein [unclassified Pseudomonas]WLH15060.1 hypothetical protein PSH57_12545 [Pseudomonas sp. FP205]WLH98108.1 hypothetical protein PSH58_12565 [Pseudomonas sp. FP53]
MPPRQYHTYADLITFVTEECCVGNPGRRSDLCSPTVVLAMPAPLT